MNLDEILNHDAIGYFLPCKGCNARVDFNVDTDFEDNRESTVYAPRDKAADYDSEDAWCGGCANLEVVA